MGPHTKEKRSRELWTLGKITTREASIASNTNTYLTELFWGFK